MKRFPAAAITVALSVALFSAGAPGQTQKPAPAPAVAATVPAASTPAPANAAPRAKSRAWTRADARVCLEFQTNIQVIRCSEKYRYMKVPA